MKLFNIKKFISEGRTPSETWPEDPFALKHAVKTSQFKQEFFDFIEELRTREDEDPYYAIQRWLDAHNISHEEGTAEVLTGLYYYYEKE